MLWEYYFLERQYDQFAEQSERMSLLYLSFDAVLTDKFSHTKLLVSEYRTISSGLTEQKFAFMQITRSWKGWIASYTPGTRVYQKRKKLAQSFQKSFMLYQKICDQILENMPSKLVEQHLSHIVLKNNEKFQHTNQSYKINYSSYKICFFKSCPKQNRENVINKKDGTVKKFLLNSCVPRSK